MAKPPMISAIFNPSLVPVSTDGISKFDLMGPEFHSLMRWVCHIFPSLLILLYLKRLLICSRYIDRLHEPVYGAIKYRLDLSVFKEVKNAKNIDSG